MTEIYIDGASAGNPGQTGIGYVIYKNNQILKTGNASLGTQTNNFAEYMALIFALIESIDIEEKSCTVFSDSKLVCEQINGNFKVKNENIYPLFVLAKQLISKLAFFKITHIDREKNKQADKLAKQATGFLI